MGHLLAVGTALCFAINSALYAAAGRRLGSGTIVHFRLLLAAALMLGYGALTAGQAYPQGLPAGAHGLLLASGVIGYVAGDSLGFEALVRIGAHMTAVVGTSYPLLAALLSFLLWGERLAPAQAVGVLLTLAGIALVIADKRRAARELAGRLDRSGLLMAFGAAFCMAAGVLMSKRAMLLGAAPVQANIVRVCAGAAAAFALYGARGLVPGQLAALKAHRADALRLAAGTLFGPVLGVSLLLTAMTLIPLGVAATLGQLSPVFLLLGGAAFAGERLHWRGAAGTLLAVLGTALLFLGR